MTFSGAADRGGVSDSRDEMYILFRNSLDVVVKTGTKRYNNAPRPTLVAVNAKTRRHVMTLRRAPLAAAAVAQTTTRHTSVSSSPGSLRAEFARRERPSRASAVIPRRSQNPNPAPNPVDPHTDPVHPSLSTPRLKDPPTRASHRLPSVDASTPLSSVFVAQNAPRTEPGSRLRNRLKVLVEGELAASALSEFITPLFWYSPTRFSKKLVLPWREMSSIQSKGLVRCTPSTCRAGRGGDRRRTRCTRHEIRVHADEGAGERVADKLLLDLDSLLDDLPDDGLVGLLVDVRVEEARKVAVKALVAADELVGEGEAA